MTDAKLFAHPLLRCHDCGTVLNSAQLGLGELCAGDEVPLGSRAFCGYCGAAYDLMPAIGWQRLRDDQLDKEDRSYQRACRAGHGEQLVGYHSKRVSKKRQS